MKIILSPAKEMDLSHPVREEWQLSPESDAVMRAVAALDEAALVKVTKVKGQQLLQAEGYVRGFDVPVSYAALDLYHGLAFRSLKRVVEWRNHESYAASHVRVLSALYGVVTPSTLVKPYRLDVTMPLHVGGQSLKAYWKERLAAVFDSGEVVVNLASAEFSELLDSSRYEWVDVAFFERRGGVLKQHSTISKKGRGLMAGWMMREEVAAVAELTAFSQEGFVYDATLSEEGRLVFVREG